MAAFAMAHPWLTFFLALAAIWTIGDVIAMIVAGVSGPPRLAQSTGSPRSWLMTPGGWQPA